MTHHIVRTGGMTRLVVLPNSVRTHRVSAIAVLGCQPRSAVLGLLAATAVLSFFLGDKQAIIIGIILAASIGLGFVNEYRTECASAALHRRPRAPRRRVRRDDEKPILGTIVTRQGTLRRYCRPRRSIAWTR